MVQVFTEEFRTSSGQATVLGFWARPKGVSHLTAGWALGLLIRQLPGGPRLPKTTQLGGAEPEMGTQLQGGNRTRAWSAHRHKRQLTWERALRQRSGQALSAFGHLFRQTAWQSWLLLPSLISLVTFTDCPRLY